MREAVEAAERAADGAPWEDELKGYCGRLYDLAGRSGFTAQSPEQLGVYFTVLKTTGAGCGTLSTIPRLANSTGGPYMLPLIGASLPVFIRDIFGHPLRPVMIDPTWLTHTAVALANLMYESRDFGAMPSLADALQDAGCESDDILSHCRGEGPHVRGCWVVDLVLGKE